MDTEAKYLPEVTQLVCGRARFQSKSLAAETEFKTIAATWSQASYSVSLRLSFLIYKMGILVLTSKD